MAGKLFTVDVDRSILVQMEKDAGRLTSALRARLDEATRDLAIMTYNKGRELADQKLGGQSEIYKAALKFDVVSPGVYSVTLGEEAEFLENGHDRFDLKPGLLKNATKRSKKGFLYRSIPMQHKTTGQGKAGTTSGDMLTDLKRLRGIFGDKGISKDANGQAFTGKVWTMTKDAMGAWNMRGQGGSDRAFVAGLSDSSKNLVGMVKYQESFRGKSGKITTKSSYITYRTVSADPRYADKWWYPAKSGVHLFDQLVDWSTSQLARIVQEAIGGGS